MTTRAPISMLRKDSMFLDKASSGWAPGGTAARLDQEGQQPVGARECLSPKTRVGTDATNGSRSCMSVRPVLCHDLLLRAITLYDWRTARSPNSRARDRPRVEEKAQHAQHP